MFSGLESFILSKLSEYKMPSLAISIVKGRDVVYANAFGFRDVERGLPASPSTVYGIGSITKSFTALAVLKLVEEGRLSLDDYVEKYVPLKIRPMGEAIRIRHLLTHTSGIPALGYAEAFLEGLLGVGDSWEPAAKPQDVLYLVNDAGEWAFEKPGRRFFYLNEGYVLLGAVVEKASGVSYWDYVKKNILKPLGMSRTYLKAEEVEKDNDVAKPYLLDPQSKRLAPARIPFGIGSDGGILSNVLDMAKYVAMLINRGSLGDVYILDRRLLEEAESKHVDIPWKLIGDEGYGYGLIISENFFGKKLVGHGGNVLVYTAYMAYLPQEEVGVTVLANSMGYPMSYIAAYALALALGKDPRQLPFLAREGVIKKLEGVYRGYKGHVSYEVKAKGDVLIARSRLGEELYLLPDEIREDYAKFYTYMRGYKIPVEFYIGEKVKMVLERYLLVK
ncbi:MAG: serine hydrolase [Pyrobaculum sp.]